MELDGDIEGFGSFENTFGFIDGKGDAFAECVHGIDQAFGGGFGKRPIAD